MNDITASRSSNRRLTVAHITHSLNVGGAETLLVSMLRHIDRENFNHIVCATTGGPVEKPLQEMGFAPIIYGPAEPGILNSARRLWRVIKIFRNYQVDIVHGHIGSGRFIGTMAGALLRVPVNIFTEHNIQRINTLFTFRALIRRRLERFLECRFADQVIAVSEAAKHAYQSRMKHRCPEVIVLHNGIALDDLELPQDFQVAGKRQELGISPSAFVVINVGQLTEQKGQTDLLSAFQIVLQSYPHTHLMIVGQGALRETLQQQAQRLGLQDNVTFTGLRDDVPELLAASDLFVLSSLWEGLPISLLEAMGMSLPAVCTNVGGINELLVDGETGLLVPPHQPSSLARAICQLIADPQQRRRYGQAGRTRVETEFNVKVIADRLCRMYQQLYDHANTGASNDSLSA